MSVTNQVATENRLLRDPRLHANTRVVCQASLAACILLFVFVFARLTFALYDRFAYMSFDLGIFNQAVWLIAHGQTPYITLRGVHTLGDHFNVFLYVIALPYRLYPSPKTLLLIQTIALALGGVPVYAIARRQLNSEWLGLMFGLAYLLCPAHQWSITYEFHPDTFATPLILTAIYALDAKRIGMYAAAILILSTIKESAGLTVICIGIWTIYGRFAVTKYLRCNSPKSHLLMSIPMDDKMNSDRQWYRNVGLATTIFGVAIAFIAMRTISVFNHHQQSAYFDLYAHYGSSPAVILSNLARHPVTFLGDVFQFANLYYFGLLIAPLGFLPLLAPDVVLIALPLLLINFMAERSGMHSTEEYYNAFITPFLFLAAIVGYSRVQRSPSFLAWSVRALLPIWVVSSQLLGPLVHPIDTIYTAQPPGSAIAECAEAVALIPTSASVSTQMAPGSHLSSRVSCYAFPNPFVRVAWGNTHLARHEIESITDSRLPANLALAVNSSAALGSAEYVVLCPSSNPFPLTHTNVTRMVVALLQCRNYESVFVGRYVMLLQRVSLRRSGLRLLAQRTGKPTSTPEEIESAYWHWLAVQASTSAR